MEKENRCMISFYSSLVFHNKTLFEKGLERSGSDARLDLISTYGISVVAEGVLTRIQTLLKSFQKNASKVSLVPFPKPMITYASPGALLI